MINAAMTNEYPVASAATRMMIGFTPAEFRVPGFGFRVGELGTQNSELETLPSQPQCCNNRRALVIGAWSFIGHWPLAIGHLLFCLPAFAQPFHLPTANRALFEAGQEEKFFVGTVGKPWTSGGFGCVRSEGWQMHEGLDIRCLHRDSHGEPADLVMATADGDVAYMNTHPSLS